MPLVHDSNSGAKASAKAALAALIAAANFSAASAHLCLVSTVQFLYLHQNLWQPCGMIHHSQKLFWQHHYRQTVTQAHC